LAKQTHIGMVSKSQSSSSGLWFRIYKTHEDSFRDFARLITEKYKTCASKSFQIEEYARCIAYSPYISESVGDNREGYRTQVEKYAKLFDPYIKEYEQIQSKKKRLTILLLSVTLLIIVIVSTIYIVKNTKK
jgi:hypothetical protein